MDKTDIKATRVFVPTPVVVHSKAYCSLSEWTECTTIMNWGAIWSVFGKYEYEFRYRFLQHLGVTYLGDPYPERDRLGIRGPKQCTASEVECAVLKCALECAQPKINRFS